jgi:hypothetical protein
VQFDAATTVVDGKAMLALSLSLSCRDGSPLRQWLLFRCVVDLVLWWNMVVNIQVGRRPSAGVKSKMMLFLRSAFVVRIGG